MHEDIIQRYQEAIALLRARMANNPTIGGNFIQENGKTCFELSYFILDSEGGDVKKKKFNPGNSAEEALENFIAVAQNLYLN